MTSELEVEVDEGLSVGASYLDEQEDRHDEEADLPDEGQVGKPTTEAEFLLLRGEVQEVAQQEQEKDILIPDDELKEDLGGEVV